MEKVDVSFRGRTRKYFVHTLDSEVHLEGVVAGVYV